MLDGDVTSQWMDAVNCLLDGNKSVYLGNMDQLNINTGLSTNVIYETTNIATASPATMSRFVIKHNQTRLIQIKGI